jgi:signal transduction histidine kinase
MVDERVNPDPQEGAGDERLLTSFFEGPPCSEVAVGDTRPAIGLTGGSDWQNVMDALWDPCALVDGQGLILMANKPWVRAVELFGSGPAKAGDDYFASLRDYATGYDPNSGLVIDAIEQIRAGRISQFEQLVEGGEYFQGRQFKVQITRVQFDDELCYLVGFIDVTQVTRLKRERRSMASRLLRAQAQERRRIARDLHDATGQQLTVLQLSLLQLKQSPSGEAAAHALTVCEEALKLVQQEIRTLSFMNFPPSLEQYGFGRALEFLAMGLGSRTGLRITTELDEPDLVPSATSGIFYRVAQEALTNIHRHAHATNVTVKLVTTDRYFHLVIEDDGIGGGRHDNRSPSGVGISGMRERLRELDGRLTLSIRDHGMMIKASVPRATQDEPPADGQEAPMPEARTAVGR